MPGSMFESPTRGTSSAPGSMFESGPVREQPEPKWAKTLTLRDAQLMLDVDPGGQLSTMQKRAISRVLNKDLSARGVMGQRFTDDLSLDNGDGNVVPYPQWKIGAMQNQQRQQAEQRSERQREANYKPGIVMQGVGEAVAPGMSLLGMATDPLFGTKFKEAAWSLQNPTLPEDMGAVESGARHVSSLAGTLMGYAMGGEMLPASPIVQRLGMFGMGTAQGLTAGESAPVALTQGVLGAAMPHFKGNFAERAIQNAGYGGVFGVGTEAARELEAGKIDLAALGKAFGSGVGAGTLMHGMTELPGFVGRPTRDVPQTQSPTGVTPAAGVSQGGVQGPPRPTMEQVAREIQDRLVRHATGNVDSVQAAMDRAQARPYTPDMGNPNEVVPGNKPFLSEDRPATSRPFFRQPMSPQEAAVAGVQRAMDIAQLRPYTPSLENPNTIPSSPEWGPVPTNRQFFENRGEVIPNGKEVRREEEGQVAPSEPEAVAPQTPPEPKAGGVITVISGTNDGRVTERFDSLDEAKRWAEDRSKNQRNTFVVMHTPDGAEHVYLDYMNEAGQGVKTHQFAPEVQKPESSPTTELSGKSGELPTKQPWEMTRDEFVAWHNEQANAYAEADKRASIAERVFGADHPRAKELRDAADKLRPESDIATVNRKWWVSRAVQTGKTVPPEVLADYPDLAPQEAKPAEPESRDPGVHGENITEADVLPTRPAKEAIPEYNRMMKEWRDATSQAAYLRKQANELHDKARKLLHSKNRKRWKELYDQARELDKQAFAQEGVADRIGKQLPGFRMDNEVVQMDDGRVVPREDAVRELGEQYGVGDEPKPAPEQKPQAEAPQKERTKRLEDYPETAAQKRQDVVRAHMQRMIDRMKRPAIWLDNELITEDGKFSVDEKGKMTKTQDLSNYGFLKNVADASQVDGKFAGLNDAAKKIVESMRVRRAEIESARQKKLAEDEAARKTEEDISGFVRDRVDKEFSEAKFKTISSDVPVESGGTRVAKGPSYKGLIVEKSSDRYTDEKYFLTHLQSGKRVGGAPTQELAKKLAVRLAGLSDFTKPAKDVLNAVGKDDYIHNIRPILREGAYAITGRDRTEYSKQFPSPTSAPKTIGQRAEDWANDIISSTEARMEARSKARGTRLSANPLPDPRDLWDAGMWMAAHAVKAGVRGGVALTKFVSDNMGKITAFDAKEHLGEIRKYAARIIKSGLGEGGAFDQAKATDYYQRATARLEAETPTGKARRLGWEQRGEVFKTQLRDFVEAAREAQRRTRMMAGIEQRGAVEAEKFKAGEKAKSVAELQDMAAELADLTPREIRGKYVRAVVDATTPLKLSRLAVRMGKDYDAYVARHAALYIQSRTSDKMMRGLTRDRADEIRKIVAGLPEDYRMILKTPRGEDKPSEYGVRLAAQNIIEARNEIARIRNEQRLEKQATLKNQVVKIAHERNQLMGAIKERPELSRPDGVDARLGLAKNLLWMKALHPERLFKWIEGSRGKTFGPWRKSFVRMDVATNRADKRVFSLTDRANDIVKRYGYKSLAHFMQETSGSLGSANTEYIDVALTNRDGKVLRQRLTRGEALSLYAMDPETRKQVLNGRPISFDSEADTFSARVTPGYLRDVFSQLSAGDKAIVDRWKEMHGKEFFDDLDRVKFNMTGSRLSPVESYFPRRVNREMMPGFEASLPKWARDMAVSLHELPFMQERTGGSSPLLIGDFGTIMLRQAHASAAVAEKAELLHLLQSTVQSPYIKTALTNRFGVQTTERVNDIIREWAGSRIGKESKFGPQVRWLMQNFGQAQTQANPRSWMRQLGTFFTMAHEVGWTDYAKHMGSVADYSEFKDLVQRRPELRKRYEHSWVGTILGSDAGAQESGMKIGETAQMTGRQLAKWAGEVPDALKTLQFHKFALEAKGANKAWNALKDHIKIANWFDGVALVPAYRAFQERARAENPTWTDKQVKDWASRATAKTFLRAANTIDTLHSDAYAQAARTDPWYATVLQFASDLSQRRNQVMEAIMDRDAGRVASASTAYAASALWSAAVTVAFGYGISHVFGLGGKQEDKDKEQAVKSGLLQVAQELAGIIPGGGRIVEAALSRPMAGRETTLTDTPLSQVFNGLARIIDETGRSMQEPGERAKLDRVDHMLRIGDQAFQLVSQVTGAPWTPFYGIARKAFKTAHPNVRETSGRVGDRGRSERR